MTETMRPDGSSTTPVDEAQRPSRRFRRRATGRAGRRSALLVGVVAAAVAVAACGSNTPAASNGSSATTAKSGSSPAAVASSKVLTISNGSSGQFVPNFNPFSPNLSPGTLGYVYEPLFFSDTIKANTYDPWLATSYAWSNGGKRITFQLRHGVKWTDGTPFTSSDVAFTFDLEMKNKQLNSYSLPFASVTTSGPYTVTINFTQPSYESFIYFATKTPIVPEHIWKSVSDPTTYTNLHPVGTGAYELSSVSGEALTFTANPHYYFPGLPSVKTVRFLSYSGNTSADAAILAGQLDWASNFIPEIKKVYVDAASTNHLVQVPVATDFLMTNDEQGPTTSLALRKAMSYAINGPFINDSVYDGEYPPSNPEELVLPNYKADLAPSLKSAALVYSPSKAITTLEAAGYKRGSNGMFSQPDGKPLDLTVQVVSGYTDYISILQIVTQEFKAVGIQLTTQAESSSAFAANQDNGKFQILMTDAGFTPSPYAYYYNLLDSNEAAPIGQSAAGDYGRFTSPQINALLAKIAGTESTSAQKPYFYQLEQLVDTDFPYVPILDPGSGTEFNGKVIQGFPTAADPYAGPDSWMNPDSGWVAARLKPAS